MSTHVFHLQFHVQTRCLRQSSNGSINSPQLGGTPSYIISFPGDETLSYTKRNRYQQINTISPNRKWPMWTVQRYHLEGSSTRTEIAQPTYFQLENGTSECVTLDHITPVDCNKHYTSCEVLLISTSFYRSMCGMSLPSWLTTSGYVMLHRYVRHTKNDPLVDEVERTDVNPTYAHIRYPGGRESTVSLKDLSPCPPSHDQHTPASPVCDTDNFQQQPI